MWGSVMRHYRSIWGKTKGFLASHAFSPPSPSVTNASSPPGFLQSSGAPRLCHTVGSRLCVLHGVSAPLLPHVHSLLSHQ